MFGQQLSKFGLTDGVSFESTSLPVTSHLYSCLSFAGWLLLPCVQGTKLYGEQLSDMGFTVLNDLFHYAPYMLRLNFPKEPLGLAVTVWASSEPTGI